ncbi:MFS-type transporter [Gracilibacillus halophilus YIM-C55.5]|uniref:MFS-type transporter n=1 Tax=Gracilibacillus halophilus YIM-C55.5 TaxID=1308866 RepID=N4W8Z9_9BACI|nr:MFS transporter [Gracilibacillus halophilus]ENH96773.1 MFS-type transporter [Gracilibacillus halophilus YIM-C55.5]
MKHNVKYGVKENLLQFSLLVVINLFVGSMVGLERTILPIIGEEQFGLKSMSAALSFIVSFGFSKACINFIAGHLADRIGRKQVLIVGWMIGLFVPLIVIFAGSWWQIVLANILLGVNQGLTWSMTVNMKVDLAKSTQRGLAVGCNEFAGYIGVALLAILSGYVASTYSLRPEPFLIGIVIVVIGMILSFFVKDTSDYIQKQSQTENESLDTKTVFHVTTWKDHNLSSISFAGLTTNVKDGMAWGLFPLFFAAQGLSVGQIGVITAVYPAAWGIFQLVTGTISDQVGRKWLIATGMMLQALSLWGILFVHHYSLWIVGAILLGIGTAMVYPTLIASISDVAQPEWRASSMGVYRFWRDSGYAFGALLAGIIADMLQVGWAIGLVAFLPLIAGLLAIFRMNETLQR